jgi:hypothetical protein
MAGLGARDSCAPIPGAGQGQLTKGAYVARRPNYDFQKRQKELKRQEKRDEKAERKRLRKEGEEGEGDAIAQGDGDMGAAGDDDEPGGP